MRALITGAAGQDGILLSQFLAAEGAEIIGLVKPGTNASFLARYCPSVSIVECDLEDASGLSHVIGEARPDELYNLGGFSSIGDSWDHPEEVRRVNLDSVRTILDAAIAVDNDMRVFQASSAAIFEGSSQYPQSERTARAPLSPYAKAKSEAMQLIDDYRTSHGLFAVSGILYNHESPLRGENFVTRRITSSVARIAAGEQQQLELGNLDVSRDWGWAPDYVRGMQLMTRAENPRDYVLSTGATHELSEFLALAFAAAGIENWRDRVVSSAELRRTTDTSQMIGDSADAYRDLGWQHTKTFDEIVTAMVDYDRTLLRDPEVMWQWDA